MDFFKVGKGSFWGVIIPGAFLFINIFAVSYSENLENLLSQSGLGYSFVVLSLLLSYIIGYILRLIKPRYVESFSVPILLLISLFLKLITKISRFLKIKKLSEFKIRSSKEILEDFPYIEWFFSIHLKQLPDTINNFFNDFKTKEYANNLDRMGAAFFNYCKHYVIENSNYLRDELYFTEGLTRFLNGMFYAIILSTTIIFIKTIHMSFEYSAFNYILMAYLAFLFIILIRYKGLRRLETVICFISFFITFNNKNEKLESA